MIRALLSKWGIEGVEYRFVGIWIGNVPVLPLFPRFSIIWREPGLVQYRIPRGPGEYDVRWGLPLWLEVGDQRLKFIIQKGERPRLVHWASGQIFADLDAAAARANPQAAAEIAIHNVVRRLGADETLRRMAAQPLVNEDI